jgi:hypothetical protein
MYLQSNITLMISDCKEIEYISDIAILLNFRISTTARSYWNSIFVERPPGYEDWKYIGCGFDNPFELTLIMELI